MGDSGNLHFEGSYEGVGVLEGKKHKPKDTWWWNGHVQKAIKEKKCYKSWHHDRSTSYMDKYKKTKKARRLVSEARVRACGELEPLGTKEGEKHV